MKVLLVSLYFPPAGGGGVQRTLKTATHLPALGIETHVLAPDDPKWVHRDDELEPPTQAWVHRARYLGPRGRRPAQELHGKSGLARTTTQARLFGRRLLVPDENVPWNLTAIPAAIRIARREGIDVVLTTSPPSSVHFVGAAVKRATGARWVADLRDSLVANPHRRTENRLARLKEQGEHRVARLVARYADAIVAAADAIADEARALEPVGRVVTIANGSDFDDFDGIEYRPSDRLRITHAGSFFGKRDPRPFLSAFAESGLDDAVVRFVGDFRPADARVGGDARARRPSGADPVRRPAPLARAPAGLRGAPAPDPRGRAGAGAGVLSGKVFEYLAAERPILAVVPPDGAAAELIRETGAGVVVAPADVAGIREALQGLHARWRAGDLDGTPLAPELRTRLARETRVEELAELMRSLAG